VTENHQAFYAAEAAKPGTEALDRGVIDLAVAGKGGNRRGNKTSKIKSFHINFLRCWPDRS
jgi:hypothetical protein